MVSTLDWSITIKTILQEKCILVIGPEVFTDNKCTTIEEQINRELELRNDKMVQQYSDGLYFFREPSHKTRFCYKLEDFYDKDFVQTKPIFSKIAKIPFHFIINLTPDKLLFEEMKNHSSCKFDFYWKNHPHSNIGEDTPSHINPLVYNMFGSLNELESLVLTHDDLFEYFESIFRAQSMSVNLKSNIKKSKTLIFLGVQFDRWYMQVLLRVLSLHINQKLLKYASNINLDEGVKSLCYDHFRVHVVPSKINEFVNDLYNYCYEKNHLRKPKIVSSITNINHEIKDEIKRAIRSANLPEAVEYMKKLISYKKEPNKSEFEYELIHIKARLENSRKNIDKGLINSEAADISFNTIITSLLTLLNKL